MTLNPDRDTPETRLDEGARTRVEAAAFRAMVEHLRERSDVQNIDLMNLAGFCRNCLSRWYGEAAEGEGITLGKDDAREIVYGEPYDAWRAKHQREATPKQETTFEDAIKAHSPRGAPSDTGGVPTKGER